MTILYVIGNGFDLHHGMATGYKHFGAFLKRDHSELRDLLDEYFVTDDEDWFWGHFEERLADFDADTLVDNSEQFIVPYSADDWSDAYHHDYAYELDRVVGALSEGLLAAFAQWIRQIAIPTPASLMSPMARIDPTARFINFNYTNTLQQLYGVPDTHVWHIHGSAAGTDPLILGHGWRPKPNETRSARLDPEREDTRVIEGAAIIDRYFEQSFKPTQRIITENDDRFASLADVDEVRVLGHSLSDVDLPYVAKIVGSVRPDAIWRISTFGDFDELTEQLGKLGSPPAASFWSLPQV